MQAVIRVVFSKQSNRRHRVVAYLLEDYDPDLRSDDTHEYMTVGSGKGKTILSAIKKNIKTFTFDNEEYYICFVKFFNTPFFYKFLSDLSDKLSDKFPQAKWLPDDFIYNELEPEIPIYINRSYNICHYEHHKTQSQFVIVSTIYKTQILLKCSYCPTCKKYFISEEILNLFEYKNIYPVNRISENSYGYEGLKARSDINIYGYNTGKNKVERRRLLLGLIDSKLFTYKEITDHISWLIRFHRNQEDFEYSISEWSSDLRFLNNNSNVDITNVDRGYLVHK